MNSQFFIYRRSVNIVLLLTTMVVYRRKGLIVISDILKRLETLGFTTYEAKAYYALLQKYPVNGYEISKLSQIPPSKIYETLQKLKNRGAVMDSQTEPVLYLPVEPALLFSRVKAETEKIIESVIDDLAEIKPIDKFELTWNLRGGRTINGKIIENIERAKREIYLSIWPEQAVLVHDSLTRALGRGVYIIAATFGACDIPANETINLEACAANVPHRAGSRLSAVVCDDIEVVIGEFTDDAETSKGIYTKTPSVTLIAKEYIKHDIMVNLLINYLGNAEYQRFCQSHEFIKYIRG